MPSKVKDRFIRREVSHTYHFFEENGITRENCSLIYAFFEDLISEIISYYPFNIEIEDHKAIYLLNPLVDPEHHFQWCLDRISNNGVKVKNDQLQNIFVYFYENFYIKENYNLELPRQELKKLLTNSNYNVNELDRVKMIYDMFDFDEYCLTTKFQISNL